jgi:hypothetical protein
VIESGNWTGWFVGSIILALLLVLYLLRMRRRRTQDSMTLESPLAAFLYFDAGGSADQDRTWGGLAAIGKDENNYLASALNTLKERNPKEVDKSSGELKGGDLRSRELVFALGQIRGHKMVFRGRRIPAPDSDQRLVEIQRGFPAMIESLSVNPKQRRRDELLKLKSRLVAYLRDVQSNKVNTHKYFSVLVEFNRLIDAIGKTGEGPNLKEVFVYVDNESFKVPEECAWGLKWFIAACLQAIGMSNKLNGNAPNEEAEEGAVQLKVDCDSAKYPGIQYVDILLQGVKRDLEDFKPFAA